MATVFRAFDAIGFRQNATSGKLDHRGQEFAFFPTTRFQHEVNEVECRFTYEEHGIRLWMEVDVKQGFREKEISRSVLLTEELFRNESDFTAFIAELIRESIVSPEFSHPEQEHAIYSHEQQGQQSPSGSPIVGMVGGLAAGVC